VLSLMAEGHANSGIAKRLWISDRTVETHVANILIKLGLDQVDEGHRRVLAVLKYLEARR
jgi:DNA-binding NarL/FixJ family response regulator